MENEENEEFVGEIIIKDTDFKFEGLKDVKIDVKRYVHYMFNLDKPFLCYGPYCRMFITANEVEAVKKILLVLYKRHLLNQKEGKILSHGVTPKMIMALTKCNKSTLNYTLFKMMPIFIHVLNGRSRRGILKFYSLNKNGIIVCKQLFGDINLHENDELDFRIGTGKT